MNNSMLRRTAFATLIAFSLATITPLAQAGVISTDQALAVAGSDAARDRIATTLARDDVQARLVAQGVDPAVVTARIAALSDAEVAQLDARMGTMPAGGDVISTLVFIFVVLLITDLLGWTHVFPFTNKGSVGN